MSDASTYLIGNSIDTDSDYQLIRLSRENSPDFKICIPRNLLDNIIADDDRRCQEAKQKEAEITGDGNRDISRSSNYDSENNSKKSKSHVDSKREELKNKTHSEWESIDLSDQIIDTKFKYKIFNSDQAVSFRLAIRSTDSDVRERIHLIYLCLLQRGTCFRSICMPSDFNALHELLSSQPHFKRVTSFVLQQLAISIQSKRPLRIPPILLVGEPGIGKTFYAQELAQALNTIVKVLSLDSELTSSTLLGSDEKWGNSKHGLLFDTIVLGDIANPIIILEELDKAIEVSGHSSPVPTLYSVLESVSARNLCDISLNFNFDASQVTWIATANDISIIDTPLKSRFEIFFIETPDARECLAIAKSVAKSTIKMIEIDGFSNDISWVRHIAHLPAREIQKLVFKAVGKAVYDNRMYLNEHDFLDQVTNEENPSNTKNTYLH